MSADSALQPTLRTERLELTPFATEHVPFLHRLWTDAAVRRFLWDDRIISQDEAAAVVDSSLGSFRQHGFGMWLLGLRPDGPQVGFCGLRHFGDPPEDVEILYGLQPAYWGTGLATEASRVVLEFAFRSGLRRVLAGADPPNAASIRVMQRLGMRYDHNRAIDGREAAYYAVHVQTDPEAILEFWFAETSHDPAKASAREKFWFGSSAETDALIRERFTPVVEAAARGDLTAWVGAPRSALALVILLDQFSRNVWRGTARAFAHDAQALATARHAVASGHLQRLSPVEQSFLILPYEHSESIEHQRESVRLFQEIALAAPPAWRRLLEYYLEFAQQHLTLIDRFGRFPHRNRVLGRESTAEEEAYLSGGGQTFGQGSG